MRRRIIERDRSRFDYGQVRTFGRQKPDPRMRPLTFRVVRDLLHGRFDLHQANDPSRYRQLPESPQFTFF
ncbi:MAG: hypothetical protein JW829_18645 [Pirellulales bacterium]|nr:hypothetical protein [Pirellulales bacterium]